MARGLGRRVGVVTAAPAELVAAGLPADVAVARADTAEATSYENVYTSAGRIQYLRAPGSPIPPETLPPAWEDARVALLGPVFHEVGAALAARFRGSVGVCGQGFLRRVGADGRVTPMPPRGWDAPPLLRHARVLFLSEEDLGGGPDAGVPADWLSATPITVLTAGWRGARVHEGGRWYDVPAVPVEEVDPTGAGDSFAAAFMAALDDGADAAEAARFAAAVASFVVEAPGHVSPSREAVAYRLAGSTFQVPRSTVRLVDHGSPDAPWNVEPGTWNERSGTPP